MAYLLEPVNAPYDPKEPLPTPLGFTVELGAFKSSDLQLKREFRPVPAEELPRSVVVGGNRPMPDFFRLAADHYYVSSRFRKVVDQHAPGTVEYIHVPFTVPVNKNPADAYYFINVLGRGQLIDWDASLKQGPRRGSGAKRYYVLAGSPDQWVMKAPPPDHSAIWHETHRTIDDLLYLGSGGDVFVTNALGAALDEAFPGQVRLLRIRELR
jgi:hypothetical protein